MFLQTAPNDISPDDAPGLQRVMEGLAPSIQQKKVDKYRQTGVLEVIFFLVQSCSCVIHLFPMLLANNNIRKKLMYCSNLLLFVLSIADSNKARQRIQTKIAKDKTKLSQAMDFYNRLVSAEDAVGPVDVILAAECPLWPWDMEAYM